MIPVHKADFILQQKLPNFGVETISFESSLNRVLAENILCDRDMPPFDRVTMDGIAIAFEQFSSQNKSFVIQDIQKAGDPIKSITDSKQCIEVMTGAILPKGVDTIIRYEDIIITDGRATINENIEIKRFQNIHKKGSDKAKSSLIIPIGQIIGIPEIGILASVGKKYVKVQKQPVIAIVSTGNELVDVSDIVEEHQIRKSNIYSIAACLKANGFTNATLHHLKDDLAHIQTFLPEIIENHDVIILSGGVSMGKFDLIPKALIALGIEEKFHQIKQKPGKPFWYGINEKKFVYALPGNPISTLICLGRYVIPHLKKGASTNLIQKYATILKEVKFQKPMTFFCPVFISQGNNSQILATQIINNGSGDFSSLQGSDGFIEFDEFHSCYPAGSVVPFYSWNN